jgi:hypothetical protein
MPAGWDLLSVPRLNAIVSALMDVREIPQDLIFLNRTPLTPAVDAEILGRFIGQVLISDIVADDAQAAVYSSGRVILEKVNIPNLKHGIMVNQEQLNQLGTINRMGGIPNSDNIFNDYLMRTMDSIIVGIRQRMEALVVAMHIDGFSYDKLGIKMQNVTWGMPSTLKVTTAVPWTDTVNSTPITDILSMFRIGVVRWGEHYDRATMSRQAFDLMTRSAEFQNRARFLLAPGQPTASIPLLDYEYMTKLAGSMLNMEIELYDARYWYQSTDGQITSAPFLPINRVVLTSKNNDNNRMAMDFANGIVTESIVASMSQQLSVIGRFGGPAYGPVGYATSPNDLNPPTVTMWGVARGFPRKHRLQASAVLNVGTLVDEIPPGLEII